MIQQLREVVRENGTTIITLRVTDSVGAITVYEVHCENCGLDKIEKENRFIHGASNIGQFYSESVAFEFADTHSCPNQHEGLPTW
jgi:hypothetical protein